MTAREWLSQIRRIEFEIRQRKAQIESMYNSIKAVSYGNVPGALQAQIDEQKRLDEEKAAAKAAIKAEREAAKANKKNK